MASSEEPQFEYDVFLSYNRRERDAGSFFPQHLHDALNQKGIKSYKYGEDLEVGEEMAPAVDEAIKGSRIAVVILSRHYVSSASCLSELVKILEQNKLNGRRAMPLFYGVEPTRVQRQTGSYHEAMAEHERQYGSGSDKVKLWRKALEEVGDIRGWTLAANQGKAEFVQGVVLEIGTALWHLKAPTAPERNLRLAKVIGILIVFALLFCSPSIIVVSSRPGRFPIYARMAIFFTNVAMYLLIAAIVLYRTTRENTA